MPDTKICSRCQQEKLLSDFQRAARRPDGLQVWCRACHGEYQRTHYSRNPQLRDARREYLREYGRRRRAEKSEVAA